MAMENVPHDVVDAKRIGFLADTHSRQPDGSDLPQSVIDAFAGVDLIVHCGDIGNQGLLKRLATLAPVLATRNDGNPGDKGAGELTRVIEAAGKRIGVVFEIGRPGIEVKVEDGLKFPDVAMDEVLRSKFGQRVDVVAFGGTHAAIEEEHDGVLFFNPGSPTLSQDPSVAVLELGDGKARVKIVKVKRS